jgi:hypothetical protein
MTTFLSQDVESEIDKRAKEMRATACAKAQATGINLPAWENSPEVVRDIYRRMVRSEMMEEAGEAAGVKVVS